MRCIEYLGISILRVCRVKVLQIWNRAQREAEEDRERLILNIQQLFETSDFHITTTISRTL